MFIGFSAALSDAECSGVMKTNNAVANVTIAGKRRGIDEVGNMGIEKEGKVGKQVF